MRVAALTVLPLLLFALVVVVVLAAQERRAVLADLTARTERIAAELDRILDRQVTLLSTLAGSSAFDADDLKKFYAEAQRARELQPEWFTIIVSDTQGQQLINLLRPFGAPLPRFPDLESHQEAVRTGKPVVVAHPERRGPISGLPVFGIRVPVMRQGRAAYVLSAGLRPDVIAQALAPMDLPSTWASGLIDAHGITIACVGCPPDGVGQAAPPDIRRHALAGVNGVFPIVTRHGTAKYLALAQARVRHWAVGMSVPSAEIAALWQRKLWILGIAGLLSVLAALTAIAFFTRRRRAIQALLETRVRQQTAALRASEERYQTLANSTREGVAIHDGGRIVDANHSFAELFGYTAEEVIGRDLAEFVAPGGPDTAPDRNERSAQPMESAGFRKDRKAFPVELSHLAIEYRGRPMQAIIVRDLTAQKQLRDVQSELARVTRLTDMGRLAAAIAHELNQPLTAVATYIGGCQRLIRRVTNQEPALTEAYEKVGLASNQALRAGEIIRRLRNFIGKGETERRVESAASVMEEACNLAFVTAKHHGVAIRLSIESAAEILVDRIQIQQVLVNLVRNAVEAMEQSPRKELDVRVSEADGQLEVRVSDTGPGLAPEIAGRLFEPFASTKLRGMGIGLSVCREIIAAHEGRIWAEPGAQGGTIFCFTLPLFEEKLEELCA